MKNLLLNSWSVSGADMDSLKLALADISARTSAVGIKSDELALVCPIGEEHDGLLPVSVASPAGVRKGNIAKETFISNGLSEDEWKEASARGFLVRSVARKRTIYPMFASIIPDIAQNYGLLGPALTTSSAAVLRDQYVMALAAMPKLLTLVLRRGEGSVSKALTIRSKDYGYIPQNFLLNIIDGVKADLGEADVAQWSIDHIITDINIEFPEMSKDISETYGIEDYTAGIHIIDSDAGEASLKVYGVLTKKGHSLYVGGEVSRKHSGEPNIADFIKSCHTQVFDKFTVLPGLLCDMAITTVDDPEGFVSSIFEKAEKAIGKKTAKKLAETIIADLPHDSLTALNIFEMLMTLPERMIAPESAKTKVRTWLSQLPKQIVDNTVEDSIEVTEA